MIVNVAARTDKTLRSDSNLLDTTETLVRSALVNATSTFATITRLRGYDAAPITPDELKDTYTGEYNLLHAGFADGVPQLWLYQLATLDHNRGCKI